MNFKQFVNERVYEILPAEPGLSVSGEFKVYINPTPSELHEFNKKPLRGCIEPDGSVLIWLEDFAEHNYVLKQLGIAQYITFSLYYGGINYTRNNSIYELNIYYGDLHQLLNNSNITKMFTHDRVIIKANGTILYDSKLPTELG